MPDPATTAWVNAVIANGGTVSGGRQTLVDNLIVGLKADGIWAKLDRLWLFAAENTPSALTDLVGDTLATNTGGVAFTVDTGYTGTDIASGAPRIDTNYTGFASSLFTQDDAHFSAWIMTNIQNAVNGSIIVQKDGAGGGLSAFGVPWSADNNTYARINDSPVSGTIGVPSTLVGHWVVNRTGASASAAYQNGSLFGSPNETTANITGTDFFILARSDGANNSPNTVSVTSMGASLTTTQITAFYNRLATYLTFAPTGATPYTFNQAGAHIVKKVEMVGY